MQADEDGAFLLSLLGPLGIAAGEPFQPDQRLERILTDAAVIGAAMCQAVSMAPRNDNLLYYPGTHWEFVLWMDTDLQKEFWRDLEPRTNYYFHAAMAAPAMKQKIIGAGSQYLRSARDNAGNWLNGSNHYRLQVPADAPVRQFWSVTVYDAETRSMIQTDTNVAAKSSYDQLVLNGDGSIDIYFGPTTPDGKDTNWIKTVDGRGWFVWFRLYAPTGPFFDKTWQLPDIEKLG